ncbi:phosphatase PAP2 family protein [Natronosporangium hydrolyticum]|uniref:Phosphatase PAP2 family protein n=1 Tax=Natronosporangium hydrolyticum TaxID=2811111 RepID=A0A895Y9V7_9ACTN|nr:phosphatase PAP2 family protein [Natronosporangium hydrolyticum]QSB13042.1 phosphatase PAP2 family protein [Natronosporangium hydrolyticum]
MRRLTWGLAAWLLLLVAAQVAAFELIRRVFVATRRGQLLDTVALNGNSIGQEHIDEVVDVVLSAMTVLSLAAATIVIGFIALMRRRVALAAAATLLIIGANLTTQVLKYAIERPEFGVDLERVGAGNSLPSGHTTVAASVAVALVLVLPPAVRGVAGLIGGAYAGLAGVATLSAGWHRPSDAVASFLVVGVWAAVAGLVLAIAHHQDRAAGPSPGHRKPLLTLLLVGLVLLAGAGGMMFLTARELAAQPAWYDQQLLFTAYAGGAAGIVGAASLMMALVLASVHVAVPPRNGSVSVRQGARSEPPTTESAAHEGSPRVASVAAP